MQTIRAVLAEFMQEFEFLRLSLRGLASVDSYVKLSSELAVLEAEKSSLQIHWYIIPYIDQLKTESDFPQSRKF